MAAHALVSADEVSAAEYQRQAAEALAVSTSLVDYRTRMTPMDRVEQSLRVSRSILIASGFALDSWEAGGSVQWPQLAACLVSAINELAAALTAAGIAIPMELAQAVALASSVAGTCHNALADPS